MVEFDLKLERFRDKETGKLVSGRAFKSLKHATFSIWKQMRASIKRSQEPSKPGRPPHTRRGQLKSAIRFAFDEKALTSFVGPTESKVGMIGRLHEHGGKRKGKKFPARPFAKPVMDRNLHRFAGGFRGSVGG